MDLPQHIRYEFFVSDENQPVIIPKDFNMRQIKYIVNVFKRFKELLGGLLWILFGYLPIFFLIQSNTS